MYRAFKFPNTLIDNLYTFERYNHHLCLTVHSFIQQTFSTCTLGIW